MKLEALEIGAQFSGIVIESRYGRGGEGEVNQSDNGYGAEEPDTNWEKKDEKERGNLRVTKGNQESQQLNTRSLCLNVLEKVF